MVLIQTQAWINMPKVNEVGAAYVFKQVLINKVFLITDYMRARCVGCGYQDFLRIFKD